MSPARKNAKNHAGKSRRGAGMPAEPRAERHETGEERPAIGAEPDPLAPDSPGIPQTWVHLAPARWAPGDIKPQKWNPRKPMGKDARAALKRGLAFYGLAGGLNAREEDGLLIGGHQRYTIICELIEEHRDDPTWLEAKNLAGGTIPVNPIRGMPDQVAMALNVLLNNREAQGEFDMPALAELVSFLDAEGFDATLTGFGETSLEDILTWAPEPTTTREERDDVDLSVPRVARTGPGDLYELGRHRLLCGDSTSAADWDRLLAGRKLDGLFTDPPYGIAYVGGTAEQMTIENDDLDEAGLERLLTGAFALAHERTKKGAAWYVFAPGGPLFFVFAKVLKALGVWRQTIGWVKDRFVLSRQDYHWRDEPCLAGETDGGEKPEGEPSARLVAESRKRKQPIIYGWRDGERHYFVDDRTQDTFWTVERPTRNAEHPTMKPVELYRRAFKNSSKPGALWCDCFAGSGSAIIAGEQTARMVYALELDPKYCDVIVKRWEQFTGLTAIRHPATDTV